MSDPFEAIYDKMCVFRHVELARLVDLQLAGKMDANIAIDEANALNPNALIIGAQRYHGLRSHRDAPRHFQLARDGKPETVLGLRTVITTDRDTLEVAYVPGWS